MMTYNEAIDYLYHATPVFQHSGGSAYKPGLETVLKLSEAFGSPHKVLKTIHVAGTNGKGSTCHLLAASLQQSGYKVGLFTSPHLVDFRERIRINGNKIDEQYVVDFTEKAKSLIGEFHPSFFELTTVMAFRYFADSNVDVAVIEVGMGGRLDSTNIISPDLSIITGISLDHTQFLGHTTKEIAFEKGGIIKPQTPVIVAEADEDTKAVFDKLSSDRNAPIYYAEKTGELESYELLPDESYIRYNTIHWGTVDSQLVGDCQPINARSALFALHLLKDKLGYHITEEGVKEGFKHVVQSTGLMGRWQVLAKKPLMICDTGHNAGGIAQIVSRLSKLTKDNLHIVFGMAGDKDVTAVVNLLPKDAHYYWCQASVDRAMPVEELQKIAHSCHLSGLSFHSVKEALDEARANATDQDIIFIGGSNFVIADLLNSLNLCK